MTRGLVRRLHKALSDDLRAPRYRGHPNPLAGHCYVASEVLYAILGPADWKPATVTHEGDVHWFLLSRDGSGRHLDATAGQFQTPVPYAQARGRGFLTAQPSRRARIVLGRLGVRVSCPI